MTVARGWYACKVTSDWEYPADLLVRALMHEAEFDQAWSVVRAHRVTLGLQRSLARASEISHKQEAIEVYTERM